MKTQFTKGKWVLESKHPKVFPSIILKTKSKTLDISVHLFSEEMVRNNYKDATYDYHKKGSISLSEENIANALLISKAPEMFEMLRLILEEKGLSDRVHSNLIYNAKQLLKEATEL